VKRWAPRSDLPLLGVVDNRSDRWKAAEARIAKTWLGRGHEMPDPADLAVIEEEQAAFDAADRMPPP